MDKRDEEKDNNQKFNDNNPDPTKEAFFFDMGNMEEEIASEAIELVTHALSLIEGRFYDDGIEILRQAIGLYDQINRIAEVDALNNKISEIYLLKEQSFRESELETDTIIEDSQEEALLEQNEEELYNQADSLIIEALQLVTNEKFDQALDKYDEATKILQKLSKELELEKLSELIEDCFNKKAEYVRIHKKASTEEIITLEQGNEEVISELELKAQRVREYKEFKRKENQTSNQAYELIGKATELRKIRQYDEAIRLYDEGLVLFQEINWNNEVKKIKNMIEQVEREKQRFLEEFQKSKAEEERADEIKKQEEAALIKSAQIQEQIKSQAQAEKLRVQSERKQEKTTFQNEITEMVDYAEKLARGYDLKVKKAIKSGKLVEECVFPTVIKIYEEVRKKVKDRGWKDQEELYVNQIKHYHTLLEKDKKLRQIEFQKLQKQKEYDESLKIKTDSTIVEVDVAQKKSFEEQRKQEAEVKNFRETIENLVNRAEKIAREYNTAFKKAIKEGNLNIESKYPKIIKIYTKARDSVLEKGWNEDAAILSSHIRKYSELLEKEKRIREIEAKKDEEKKAYEEFHKIQKKEIEVEKIKEIEAQKVKEFEEDKFQKEITDLVDKAERMAHDYEVALKKAIRAGKLIEKSPYSRIIEIYHQIREGVISRGWKDQILMYTNQIRVYQEKLESDNKLREIEIRKIQKQKDFEESLKVKPESIPLEKLKEIESKKSKKLEEQNFQKEITVIVDKAEKLAREYERAKKSALKEGRDLGEAPYFEIIELYTKVRNKVLTRGWSDQALIYANQIKIYQEKLESDKKLRQIELEKIQKQKDYDESLKVKTDSIPLEKLKEIETKKSKKLEEDKFQKKITEIVDKAEKLAREYEMAKKRALKEGKDLGEAPYFEIIEIYTNLRNKVLARGWKDQASLYAEQTKIYEEKLESDNKIRQIELEKIQKQKEFEEALKVKKESISPEKLKEIETKKSKKLEKDKFQKEITEIVDKAEGMAHDYEVAKKGALKEGKDLGEAPYSEIIELYTKLRNKVLTRGWSDQALIYAEQIKSYQEKLESDKKLRQIELEKIQKQKEFEEALKVKKESKSPEKLKEIERLLKQEQEEEKFEREIDDLVDNAEKLAREYDLAIKRGEFEKECPYLIIAELYKKIREKVYARGWKDEADLYGNQINHYREKNEKDKRLRELEAKKEEKQKDFEESLKITKEVKKLKLQEIQAIESKDKESDRRLNEAMAHINEAENEVRSYELSLKKDFLNYKSPYEKAISNYEKARKLFQKIGWKEEAHRLISTITFYKEKKVKDDNLRLIEQQKLEVPKEKLIYKPKEEVFAHEKKIIEFEKIKEATTKESEESFNIINRAERLAKEYEIKKKKGILNIESPYEEIINMYMTAKKEFEKIGWNEQANQIINSIHHYQEKSKADKNLRALETEKISKEEEEIKKQKIETLLAREAEAELLKQKAQALELKRKHALEYESKKEQAFNFMDLAKKEFKLNNFEKAINFYKESEKIFTEINWSEGQKMIKESIRVIKLKKERIVQEQEVAERQKAERLKLEAQIEDEIIKAKDLQKLQQDQRRREFLAIQKEKEREREISENAYHFLEEGTKLKNKKKFEEAFEKYIMGRDLFKQIGWQHEVSRINNDLLFILKKEMKQTEKIKAMQQKKVEEQKELEVLLKEAEKKRKELDQIKKEEKRKRREEIVQKELDAANDIIKNLKYNEGILMLKKVIKKLEKLKQDKLVKQMIKQIEVLENASQVPIITTSELERGENINKFELAYQALDKAQISLSNNLFMKAITELNETVFNLRETKIGIKYISLIENKVNAYKKELDIKTVQEQKVEVPKDETDDIRVKIAARRAERRKKIKELMSK